MQSSSARIKKVTDSATGARSVKAYGKVLPTSNGKHFGPVIIGMVGEVGSDRLHETRERFMIVGWIVR